MVPTDAEIDQLTERIIGCAIEVHRTLGAGLLESVYRECMVTELRNGQLRFETERRLKLMYKGTPISSQLRLDLLVEGIVVVELKTVERIHPIHLAQVITYLKLTGCAAGLLLNFNVTSLRSGIRRLTHPDRYKVKVISS